MVNPICSYPATQPPSHPAQSTKTTDSKGTSFLRLLSTFFNCTKTSTNRASQSTTTPTSEKKLTILSYLFAPLKRGYLFYPSAKSVNQVLEEAIKNPDNKEAIDKATSYLYDFIQHEIPGGGIQTIGDFLENKIKQDVYNKLYTFIDANTSNQYIFLENGSLALKEKIQYFCLKKISSQTTPPTRSIGDLSQALFKSELSTPDLDTENTTPPTTDPAVSHATLADLSQRLF